MIKRFLKKKNSNNCENSSKFYKPTIRDLEDLFKEEEKTDLQKFTITFAIKKHEK